MLPRLSPLHLLLSLLFLQAAVPTSAAATSSSRHVIRVITVDDLAAAAADSAATAPAPAAEDSPEWDDFVDPDTKLEEELDPGSWRAVLEPKPNSTVDPDPRAALYASGIRGLLSAVSTADLAALQAAVRDLEESAASGYAHAQSAVGFLYGSRILTPGSAPKAFLHHQFAARGGDAQSKLALAYTYYRQEMYEKAIELYAELAEAAVASFLISKDQPAIEIVRIHSGSEENKEALRKAQGVEDEAFQVTEHQALRGHAASMYKMGMFYYFGLRGVKRDNKKALYWFSKAVEKGEPRAMELLGEIYASGAGAEKNYTKALEWLTLSSKQKHFSAYNGLGYLYVKGYGVEKENYTKAREYFEKAAANNEAGGFYNLGVLYLKGIGVKRDVAFARKCFTTAASVGQPKALYQVAKMFQKGIGLKKNIVLATTLFKLVAEKGPWSSLSRWALESYANGDMGKALLLYLRMAELGYEVAQSNAAWLLDKFGENSLCIGKSGFCTSAERHLLAHSLWWQATEQGNEHAALLIGDAYYYGRGTERDYERAAEAYMHARSQSNAQAMFNLGYMHERGEGIPLDFHLAKRYYDQALAKDQDAKLAVTLALVSLWIRKNYADSYMVDLINSLPHFFPQVKAWVDEIITGEENIMIITLFVSLLTILYVRERRRHAALPFQQPNEGHD